jgi:type II secretory pathway predicted ATPase ExeA
MPPYLAGRVEERAEFERLLKQEVILENLVLTGLRGLGKTVLLDSLRPIAIGQGWNWVGSDLSEVSSLTEQNMATRILTDLSVVTSSIVIGSDEIKEHLFAEETITRTHTLSFGMLVSVYDRTPGLNADKLKRVLELVWEHIRPTGKRGVVFAYDEAQNVADHASTNEYPLSLLLDVFQSIQKKGIPFLLVLTGLPTLFPKLVEARTFSERMFRVVFLDRLNEADSRDAILKPIGDSGHPLMFDSQSVSMIFADSGGYPYFIQFICKESFDVFVQRVLLDEIPSVPREEIIRKLDSDFFAGRWARATDRQRELLWVITCLENCDGEFTVQEIVQASKRHLEKPFSASHVNQILATLAANGLIYKNRHGKYSLAVPLLDRYIKRQGRPGQ